MATINKTSIVLRAMLIILVCPVVWTKSWAEDCNKDSTFQADMNLYTIDYAKKAELELDAVYEKLMKKISPRGRANPPRRAHRIAMPHTAVRDDTMGYLYFIFSTSGFGLNG